jgi:RNA polymerase sigma factor (sigma-70 family)
MDDADFMVWLTKAAGGDEAAFRDLLRHCEPEVRMIVRSWLPKVLRSKFDSTDFVQEVWEIVFVRGAVDLTRFESARHFLKYLEGVAYNKVHEEYRRRTRTKKYALARETPLYVRRQGREVAVDVAGHNPTPSQEAVADERFDQLLNERSPNEQEMIRLRRNGLTFTEIGAKLNCHEAVVRRVMADVARRWEER